MAGMDKVQQKRSGENIAVHLHFQKKAPNRVLYQHRYNKYNGISIRPISGSLKICDRILAKIRDEPRVSDLYPDFPRIWNLRNYMRIHTSREDYSKAWRSLLA
jgi:hypothetical protein